MFKCRLRENTGSALVELALTAPFLLILIIGSAELGRIAYAAVEVQNAARAAAAYAAQTPLTSATSNATIAQDAGANEAANISSLTTTPTLTCTCETISSAGVITYSSTSGNGGSSTPVFGSCTTIAANAANCENPPPTTPPAGQISVIVAYVQVTTTATVHTMFTWNWKHFGLPSTFTLTGYSNMRVLDNQ